LGPNTEGMPGVHAATISEGWPARCGLLGADACLGARLYSATACSGLIYGPACGADAPGDAPCFGARILGAITGVV
jgi:hypothetical protein